MKILLILTLLFHTIPNIQSSYITTYDYTSKQLVYSVQGDTRTDMASLTKIMTAYISVLKIENMNKKVYITKKDKDKADDLAKSSFKVKEKITYKDLLYSVIFQSAADSCFTLARTLYKTDKAMINDMNDMAKQIGMNNTHFTNITGATSNNHYSSTNDMIKLMNVVYKNKMMKKLFLDKTYTTSNKKHTLISFIEKNKSLSDSYILGAKTGNTKQAGYCLASISKIKNHIIFTVSMKANKNEQITDAVEINSWIKTIDYKDYPKTNMDVSTYTIKPTSITSIKKSKKYITIKWKKQTLLTQGYQIQYSKKKNFKTYKTITIKNNQIKKTKIKKKYKKYHIRIRTFMIIDKKYYSTWDVKYIKTKK